jgi:hypothetical protein
MISDDFARTNERPGRHEPISVKPIHRRRPPSIRSTGEVDDGILHVEVIDALTAPNTRVVTAALADANARQQLLSRRTYGETSTDGSSWTPLFGGYVNRRGLRHAGRLQLHDRRDAPDTPTRTCSRAPSSLRTSTAFRSRSRSVRQGHLHLRRSDPRWLALGAGSGRLAIQGHQAVAGPPKYVQMKMVRAFDARKPEMGTFSTLSSAIVDYMCGVAAPYYRESPTGSPRRSAAGSRDPLPRAVDDGHARRKLHAALRARPS